MPYEYINECHKGRYVLAVFECRCGFHIGLDATYLEQVGDIVTECPNCHHQIDTGDFDLGDKDD